MRQTTFLRGVTVAAALALLGSIAFTALLPLTFGQEPYHGLIAALGLAYLLHLLSSSGERVGRITTVSLWALMSLGLWFIGVSPGLYLVAQIAALWLVRSLYFYSSALAAVLDLALNLLAVAAAYWAAVHTGSVLLSIWCFFLVQALFVAIPPVVNPPGNTRRQPVTCNEKFERARLDAEKAIQQLFAR